MLVKEDVGRGEELEKDRREYGLEKGTRNRKGVGEENKIVVG